MRRLALALLLAIAVAAAGTAFAAGSAQVPACGYVRASVPYTRGGHGDRWRVYLHGHATCAAALRVLDAVMHLRGSVHQGSSDAGSWTDDGVWRCPFGDSGIQVCVTPFHTPFRAKALAVDCKVAAGGCPATEPLAYF